MSKLKEQGGTKVARSRKVEAVEPVPDEVTAKITVEDGPDRGRSMALEDSILTIGRGEHCGLVLKDESVSTEHVEIRYTGGGFRIRDMNSTNGTLLNDSPLQEFTLANRDMIRLGDTILSVKIHDWWWTLSAASYGCSSRCRSLYSQP